MQIGSTTCNACSAFHRPQPQHSAEAKHANANSTAAEETKTGDKTEATNNKETNASQNNNQNVKQNQQLSQAGQKEVQKLQDRDREVRAHEAAHKAAAGSLANGGASFSHQRGPDGKLYAVGGEVSIDTSKVSGDPQATIQKANQIRSAALAPAQPSSQDQAVAANAAMMAAEARKELATENREKMETSETAENSETNQAVTETKTQSDKPHSTETQHYQAVANSALDTPPKLDLMA